jgi:hypothetical protein
MAVESIWRYALNYLSRTYHCRIEKYGLERTTGGGVLFTALTDKDLDVHVIAADINRTSAAKHGAEARGIRQYKLINVYDNSGRLDIVIQIVDEGFIKWLMARLWKRTDYFTFPLSSMAPVVKLLDDLDRPDFLTVGPVMHESFNDSKHVVRAPILYRGRCIMVMRRHMDAEDDLITIDLPEGDEDPFAKYASDNQNLKRLQFPTVNWFFDK